MSDLNQTIVGTGEAAKVAGRSRAWVRKALAAGTLKAERDADGVYLFQRADLEAVAGTAKAAPINAAVAPPAERDLAARVEHLEGEVQQLGATVRTLIEYIKASRAWAKANPIAALSEAYRCDRCEVGGLVAVRVRCTSCNLEEWIGSWPKDGKATE